MIKLFFALLTLVVMTNTVVAQTKEPPKQCRAAYSTLANNQSHMRSERNSGAVLLEVDPLNRTGTIRTNRGLQAFSSPPADISQYPLVAPMKIQPQPNGSLAFEFKRADDNVEVKGLMTPSPDGKEWQVTLIPQGAGRHSATGTCSTG